MTAAAAGWILAYREELPDWDRCVAYTHAGSRCRRRVPRHPDPHQQYLVCGQHQHACLCRWEDLVDDEETFVHRVGDARIVTGLMCKRCRRRWDLVL